MDSKKYILLIDGDNVNCTYLEPFLNHIQQHYGEVCEIHLFGKLESTYLRDWKQMTSAPLKKTICYNVSENCKNNTDIQMIHFAWKRFYGDHIHNFIIMSSDSDMQAVVSDLCSEAEVIIGYNRHKVAAKYLQYLKEHNVKSVDMDRIRGELSNASIDTIVNCTAQSYLEFKLGRDFFSYDTIIDWLKDRYPDITGITQERLISALDDYKLSFTPKGVKISRIE